MSWTIERDLLTTGDDRTDVGVSGFGLTVTADTPGAERFELLDDDGVRYYTGWLVDDDECPYGYGAWESALSWGQNNAGCTTISDGRGEVVIG